VDQAVIHRHVSTEFDPVSGGRVPLGGHPVSTGAACPQQGRQDGLSCGWAVPAERPAAHLHPVWTRPKKLIWHRRTSREQAYLSAEQPSPSQGARFPPAHAHPRGSQHPVGAPPQGSQQPGRLTRPTDDPPVLAKAHRLTSSEAFRQAVRSGSRAGSRTLVVHLVRRDEGDCQVGFVVSRAVGNAVARNRVKRRLRHLARERLSSLPGSCVLVVRALPAAADAAWLELGADLDRCLKRVTQ
jgi:ribonuclease P protein component